MIETLEKPTTSTVPKKVWRNKFRAQIRIEFTKMGSPLKDVEENEEFWGWKLHPSKEIAETRGLEQEIKDLAEFGFFIAKYLGSYSEDAA